jgi:hypothetical protein
MIESRQSNKNDGVLGIGRSSLFPERIYSADEISRYRWQRVFGAASKFQPLNFVVPQAGGA